MAPNPIRELLPYTIEYNIMLVNAGMTEGQIDAHWRANSVAALRRNGLPVPPIPSNEQLVGGNNYGVINNGAVMPPGSQAVGSMAGNQMRPPPPPPQYVYPRQVSHPAPPHGGQGSMRYPVDGSRMMVQPQSGRTVALRGYQGGPMPMNGMYHQQQPRRQMAPVPMQAMGMQPSAMPLAGTQYGPMVNNAVSYQQQPFGAMYNGSSPPMQFQAGQRPGNSMTAPPPPKRQTTYQKSPPSGTQGGYGPGFDFDMGPAMQPPPSSMPQDGIAFDNPTEGSLSY